MSAFAPLTEVQFQQLAMGKARGFTWNLMADQLSLPLEVVERVPWTHEKLWNRYLGKAEKLVARETIAEVVGTLRRDVRNAEPNLHATLTNSLTRLLQLQQDFAPKPHRPPAPAPVPVAIPTSTPPTPLPTPQEGRSMLPVKAEPTPTVGPKLGPTLAALGGLLFLIALLLSGAARGATPLGGDPMAMVVVTGEETNATHAVLPSLPPTLAPKAVVQPHLTKSLSPLCLLRPDTAQPRRPAERSVLACWAVQHNDRAHRCT